LVGWTSEWRAAFIHRRKSTSTRMSFGSVHAYVRAFQASTHWARREQHQASDSLSLSSPPLLPHPLISFLSIIVVVSTTPARHHHSFWCLRRLSFVLSLRQPLRPRPVALLGLAFLYSLLPFHTHVRSPLPPRRQRRESLAFRPRASGDTFRTCLVATCALEAQLSSLSLTPGPARFQLSTGTTSRTVHDNDSTLLACYRSGNTSGRLSRL
jgi:hypothetical protein